MPSLALARREEVPLGVWILGTTNSCDPFPAAFQLTQYRHFIHRRRLLLESRDGDCNPVNLQSLENRRWDRRL